MSKYEDKDFLFSKDVQSISDAHDKKGVLTGLEVTPGTGLQINISAGTFSLNGTNSSYAGGSANISSPHATLPRKDTVSLSSDGVITVTAGTPETNLPADESGRATYRPIAPNTPPGHILLAELYVLPASVGILAENIFDLKQIIKFVDDQTIEEVDGLYEVKDLGITADKIAENVDASAKGFNADQVDGRDVNDAGSTTNDLWTAEKIQTELNTKADDTDLNTHVEDTANPHSVTKTQVGLGNVSNDAQLKIASNLSDLNNTGTARTNLDVDSKAEVSGKVSAHADLTNNPHAVTKTQVGLGNVTDDAQLKIASNLSDLNNATTARTNLGLGSAATKNVGTSEGNVPELQAGGKLSDSVIPSLAITDIVSVADDTARDALTPQAGDIAIVDSSAEAGDEPATYIWDGTVWKKIKAPTDAVNSVFGRQGTVIAESGDYTWAQINKATSDIADITTKSHTSLSDIGTNTHADIDTHISDAGKHREINDAGSGATDLWSANKISTDLATKENTANKSTDTDLGSSNDLFPTQNAVKTYTDTLDAQNVKITGDQEINGQKEIQNLLNDQLNKAPVSQVVDFSVVGGVLNGDLKEDWDITTDGVHASTSYNFDLTDLRYIFENRRNLKITLGTTSTDAWVQFNNFFRVKSGKNYRLIFRTRTSEGTQTRQLRLILDGTGQDLGVHNWNAIDVWSVVVVDFTATADATGIRLKAENTLNADIYIQDIELQEVGSFDQEITNISETQVNVIPNNSYDQIDQEALTNSADEAFGTSSISHIAQQILPGKDKLAGITFRRGANTGTFDGEVYVTIRADDSGSPDTDIIAKHLIAPEDWNAITENEDYFLPIPCVLDADGINKYWIVFESETTDDTNHPSIRISDASDPYADGMIKNSADGTTWSDTGFTDKAFYFQTIYGARPEGIGLVINGQKIEYLNEEGIWGAVYNLNEGFFIGHILKLPVAGISDIYDAAPSLIDNIPYGWYGDTTKDVMWGRWAFNGTDIQGVAQNVTLPARLRKNFFTYTDGLPNRAFWMNFAKINTPIVDAATQNPSGWTYIGNARNQNGPSTYYKSAGVKDFAFRYVKQASDNRAMTNQMISGWFENNSDFTGLLYPINQENRFTEHIELQAETQRLYFRTKRYANEDGIVMPAIEIMGVSTETGWNIQKIIFLRLDNSQEADPCISIILDETTNAQASGTGSAEGSTGYILNSGEYITLSSPTKSLKLTYKVGTGTTTFSNITKNSIYLFSNARNLSTRRPTNFSFFANIGAKDTGVTQALLRTERKTRKQRSFSDWYEYDTDIVYSGGANDPDAAQINFARFRSDGNKTEIALQYEITTIGSGNRTHITFDLPTRPVRNSVYVAFSGIQASDDFAPARIDADDRTIAVETTMNKNGLVDINISYEEEQ